MEIPTTAKNFLQWSPKLKYICYLVRVVLVLALNGHTFYLNTAAIWINNKRTATVEGHASVLLSDSKNQQLETETRGISVSCLVGHVLPRNMNYYLFFNILNMFALHAHERR